MGLGISVGLLCDQARNDPEGYEHYRTAFEHLTNALAPEGVDWHEPQTIHNAGDEHDFSASFPYRYVSHLRRIYTLTLLGEPVTPAASISEAQYESDQEQVTDEMTMFASHLLCHADDAGYYIPVDFPDPLFLPQQAKIPGGGMVGSTQQLLAELMGFAPAIGIHLDERGEIQQTQAAESAGDADAFEPEPYAWSQMYQACRASIASGHAIVFC